MIFKEETLETEKIYEGAILNLRRDKVTVKNGKTSHREIVEHNGGAVAIAITDDNQVVMVKQFRKPFERAVLEVPAGKIEDNEDPLETIKRELREETGYRAKKITKLCEMLPSVGYTTEVLHVFLAEDLEEGETDFDENEAIEILKYPFFELVSMIMNGEIKDGKTIVAVLMAKNKLGI